MTFKWFKQIKQKSIVYLLPVVLISPIVLITSCATTANQPSQNPIVHNPLPFQGLDQPDPNWSDLEKAIQTTKLFFAAKASLYAAWKPSEVQVYNVSNKIAIQPDLGFLDPRQNYGFQMKWDLNSIKDDDLNGTKSGTIILSRGSETTKIPMTISGFLTTDAAAIEKANQHLNPEFAIQLFDRLQLNTKSIKINPNTYIDDFYNDYHNDLTRLASDFERLIIVDQYQDRTKIEFKDFYQTNRFGIQIPEMSAWYRLVDRHNPDLKSGWYRITWIGFDPIKNNLKTAALFNKYVVDWQTISNMLFIDDPKAGYLTKVKPSTVQDLDHFQQLIDQDMLTKQNLIAKPLRIISSNDQLGYLEVAFDLNYKNGPNDFAGWTNYPVKIFGFLPVA